MNKSAIKKPLIIVLILSPLLLLSYCGVESHIAREQAESICNDIKRGIDTAELTALLDKKNIPVLSAHPSLGELVRQPHYSFPRPDLMVASIPSAFGDRWVCGARLIDGKVINKEVRPMQ